MPTVLFVQGWPRLRREIRQIIFEHFGQIIVAWREHFGENRAE